MKETQKFLDKSAKNYFNEEEAKLYDDLGEQNIFKMISNLFQGQMGWIMYLVNFFMIVIFVLFIYCLIQFFKAEELEETIKWMAGGGLCLMAIWIIKIFDWMQIHKNEMSREIKRLQLQILAMERKLDR